MGMIEPVLKAFYHKSRKTFVAWTFPELCGRTTVPTTRLPSLLGQCRASGLMDKVKTNTPDANAWELTPKGKALAQKYIDGEAFIKAPPAPLPDAVPAMAMAA